MTPDHNESLSCEKHVSPSLVILLLNTGRRYFGFKFNSVLGFCHVLHVNIIAVPRSCFCPQSPKLTAALGRLGPNLHSSSVVVLSNLTSGLFQSQQH